MEARLRQYVWLGWGVAGLGGFRVGWLVDWGGWGSDRQPPAPTPWDTRPTREGEPRWRPGLYGEGGASGGETCDLRSSSTPALSRPEVPGMRTAVSPHPGRHSAGAIRPDHRSWDRVQGGVYEASSLYTSD
jgi:hypothetical protein